MQSLVVSNRGLGVRGDCISALGNHHHFVDILKLDGACHKIASITGTALAPLCEEVLHQRSARFARRTGLARKMRSSNAVARRLSNPPSLKIIRSFGDGSPAFDSVQRRQEVLKPDEAARLISCTLRRTSFAVIFKSDASIRSHYSGLRSE